MRIHPLNYEQYALDYLEGNMEPETKTAFKEFLAEHPGIEKEVQEMKLFYASPDPSEAYPNKEDLMKSPPAATASVFHLPQWAVAASWLIAIGSFALWMFNEQQTSVNEQVATHNAVIETLTDIEEDIVVVQVDVNRPASNTEEATNQAELETDYQTPIQQTANEFMHSTIAQGSKAEPSEEEIEPDPTAPQNPELKNTVAFLPQHSELDEMEVFSQSPEVVYYKPISNWESEKSNIQSTKEEPRLAIMSPLKRVMKPESYKKIREFDLMDDVINEIDGREVAHALTPEFLRTNR